MKGQANMLAKLMSSCFTITGMFAASVLTSIYGWGLTPVSWPWIVGGFVAILILNMLNQIILKSK